MAIRTEDLEVFQTVVVSDAVAVMKLKGQRLAPPAGDAADLAGADLQARGDEAPLEVVPARLAPDW